MQTCNRFCLSTIYLRAIFIKCDSTVLPFIPLVFSAYEEVHAFKKVYIRVPFQTVYDVLDPGLIARQREKIVDVFIVALHIHVSSLQVQPQPV